MNASYNVYESHKHNIDQNKLDTKSMQYDFIFSIKTIELRSAWLGDKTKEIKVISIKIWLVVTSGGTEEMEEAWGNFWDIVPFLFGWWFLWMFDLW